jgi:hypothetical protein
MPLASNERAEMTEPDIEPEGDQIPVPAPEAFESLGTGSRKEASAALPATASHP